MDMNNVSRFVLSFKAGLVHANVREEFLLFVRLGCIGVNQLDFQGEG